MHRSQLGLLYRVLNGRWVPRLLLRLMIVSCSGSSVGTNWKWLMATWIVTDTLRDKRESIDFSGQYYSLEASIRHSG